MKGVQMWEVRQKLCSHQVYEHSGLVLALDKAMSTAQSHSYHNGKCTLALLVKTTTP